MENENESLMHFEKLGGLRSKRYRPDLKRNVYSIYFRHAPIRDKDLRPIRLLKSIIDAVVLDHTLITDLSLSYLSQLETLESLELSGTSISDKGLVYLEQMHSLECLYLDSTEVTQSGVERLSKCLLKCEIVSDFD